jgi:secondary thiamine-phosphate synthase enzyme
MTVYTEDITFKTTGEGQIIDINDKIEAIVQRSGIKTGIVSSSVAGATAALTVIEFEPGLVEDFPAMLQRIAPKDIEYAHHRTWDDGNGHSHIRASLIGPDLNSPVRDGELFRGKWQHSIFLELDVRPARDRVVLVTVIGE